MNRKILLIEPNYKNKYPPMGLMKLATYFRRCNDDVRFYKGDLRTFAARLLCEEFYSEINDVSLGRFFPKLTEYIKTGKYAYLDEIPGFRGSEYEEKIKLYRRRFVRKDYAQFDIVGVTTLFTFYWKQTISTINDAKKFCKPNGRMLVGGIASSILPDQMYKDTGIRPHQGLLDKPGDIDEGNTDIIDELPLDYSILEEIDYQYPANNAYFGYMTRGCIRKCSFCAVSRLEPHYKEHISIKKQLEYVDQHFGVRKDLLLMDNNVFASGCFFDIIDEIKDCGFAKGAKYKPSNEYNIALQNIQIGYNLRGYLKKIVSLYDKISDCISKKLTNEEAGEFYLERERLGLLYPETATVASVLEFDQIAREYYSKFFKFGHRVRYIDFNQGIDARLVTDERMAKLSEINIRPLRIAFDHYEQKDIYIEAVKKAAKYGISNLSNYLLYNFKDKPEELYYRMRINVDLCEELDVTIYSFPMKYHPIDDPEFYDNRDYIGEHWNRKFIRAIQAVLNSTKGKIGRGIEFFEEAFGCNIDEFEKILWMPETFIIYRRKYDAKLRERLAGKYTSHSDDDCDLANEWWQKFQNLTPKRKEKAKKIIALNKFDDENYSCRDKAVLEVLSYYKIKRS
ncbi:MAG: hypothetical protein NC247_08425 [Ruminococcus flavefaciens]|nr:hypothetical protein [Ruminococcus flavefaciens]MCM1362603.1 hypothetical protein [Clostridiales bacterium]